MKQPYAPDLQYMCFDGCCENNCPIVTCKYCGQYWPCPDYIANHTPDQVEAQHRYVDRKWYGDDKEMVEYSARERVLKEKL